MKSVVKIVCLISLIVISCNPPVPDNTLRFDFLENFEKVVKQPSPEKVFKYQKWQKSTEGRDAMVIGVFGEAGFTLLPEQTGEHLYFGLRLNIPDSARAECVIVVQTLSQSDTVFRRLMDAARFIQDRNWSDHYVDMSRYLNQSITVRFSTQYWGTDAWAEWSSPILVTGDK